MKINKDSLKARVNNISKEYSITSSFLLKLSINCCLDVEIT